MADNLTRDEARERAALINVASYDVELDLTGPVETTFRSRTDRDFHQPPARCVHLHRDRRPRSCNRATLNGEPVDLSGFDGSRLALPAVAEANELVVDARVRCTPAPARDCTASSTRSTARSISTASSRPTTRTACTPASTSPTSRPISGSTSRLRRTGPSSAMASAPRIRTPPPTEHRRLDLRADPADVHLHHRVDRRSVLLGLRPPRRHRPRAVLPRIAR